MAKLQTREYGMRPGIWFFSRGHSSIWAPLTIVQLKDGGNHYYSALLKPNEYDVAGCNHDDVDGSHLPSANIFEYQTALRKVISSRTTAQHEENRKDTASGKPSDTVRSGQTYLA